MNNKKPGIVANLFYRRLNLLKIQSFRWFVLNCLFSNVSSGLIYVAMSWLIIDKRNSISSLAILMMCFWLPTIILAPLYGLITDFFPLKKLMVISNILRACLLLAIALSSAIQFNHHTLYLTAFFLSVFGNLYSPASFRYMREIVAVEHLLHANSMINFSYEIGNVLGMGIAGFLLTAVSAHWILAVSGLLFLIGAFYLGLMQASLPTVHKKIKHISWNSFKESLIYLGQRKDIMIIYSIQIILYAIYFTAPSLAAPFVKLVLHASSREFGLVQASFSIGLILGGILAPWLVDLFGLRPVLFVKVGIIAFLFLIFSIANYILLLIGIYFLIGLSLAAWSLIITKAQIMVLPTFSAKIQAIMNGIAAIVVLIIFFLLNFTGNFVSTQTLYVLEAIFAFIALYLLWKQRHSFEKMY